MAGTDPRDPRVDDLRQRLRSLGYLDAGVDRFVLAPARAERRPLTIALLSSARIGLLAALLLGPAAAVGVGGRVPGLVTGPRDAIVIAVYIGVLFGIAIAAAAFTASLAVSLIARRSSGALTRHARRWSLAAGFIVAAVCLAYLTLWWRTANAGFGWAAPLWTLFALGVASAISLLLGHAVTVTTLALIVSRSGGLVEGRGVPGASWRVSIAAGVAAFAGAAVLLLLSAPGAASSETPQLTVVSSGLRLRVIGIDGVDGRVLDGLSAAGRIPALAAAFAGAHASIDARGADARAGDAPDPARSWTTIATGQPAEAHGVHGLETRRVTGLRGTIAAARGSRLGSSISAATDLLRLTRPSIASGAERREKTFWEVASEAGLRTAVVNWWATWPASASAGVVLTDRATLRLERGGELDAEIAPADLYPPLRARWPDVRSRAAVNAASALEGALEPDVRAVLQRSAELDAMQLLLAGELAEPRPDLVAIYLPGLDIAQHALLSGDEGRVLTPSAMASRLEALEAYYVALDRLLAPALTPQAGELVLIATAGGRVSSAAPGRLALRGTVARSGASVAGASVDIAPTILHALGVPVSRSVAGTPMLALMSPEFTSRYPVRYVPTYGPPSATRAARQGQPLDQEMIDRLRSLGYVK